MTTFGIPRNPNYAYKIVRSLDDNGNEVSFDTATKLILKPEDPYSEIKECRLNIEIFKDSGGIMYLLSGNTSVDLVPGKGNRNVYGFETKTLKKVNPEPNTGGRYAGKKKRESKRTANVKSRRHRSYRSRRMRK
jgi:hypothetical protein